jgi:hypothetical protein
MKLAAVFAAIPVATATLRGSATLLSDPFLMATSDGLLNDGACWKDSYGRGVGRPIHACDANAGLERDPHGALCYPFCSAGFYGVGPVCWEYCAEGWVDEGALCRKDGSIETVAKRSYGRGAGYPLGCAASEEYDAGLCYDPCTNDWDGIGPVCWERCEATLPTDGGAICCTNGDVCKQTILDMTFGLPKAVAEIVMSGGDPAEVKKAVKDAVTAALGFVLPLCDEVH